MGGQGDPLFVIDSFWRSRQLIPLHRSVNILTSGVLVPAWLYPFSPVAAGNYVVQLARLSG